MFLPRPAFICGKQNYICALFPEDGVTFPLSKGGCSSISGSRRPIHLPDMLLIGRSLFLCVFAGFCMFYFFI